MGTVDGHLYFWNFETGHLNDFIDVRIRLLCKTSDNLVTPNENIAAEKCFLSLTYR